MTKAPVLAGLTAVALSSACPEAAPPAGPAILVDACRAPEVRVGAFVGGFEECAIELGAVDISTEKDVRVTVMNPSSVPLTLLDVALVGDPAYLLEENPSVIAAASSSEVRVSFRANVESTQTATLFLLSDAKNTPQDADGNSVVSVDLSANGVNNGIPDVDVGPATCDFGAVVVGAVGSCDVTLRNRGNRDLVIDGVAVDDDCGAGCPFRVAPVGVGTPLPADTAVVIVVDFLPEVPATFDALLSVFSNDPDEPRIDVTLVGVGVVP